MESGGCAVAPCACRASFCWGNSDVRENASGVVTPLGRLCNSFWQGGGCHVPSRPIVAEPRKCWRIHKNDGIVSILSGGRAHAIFFSGKASVGLSDRRIDRRRPPHDPRGGPARHQGTWGRAESRPRAGHKPRGLAEGPARRARPRGQADGPSTAHPSLGPRGRVQTSVERRMRGLASARQGWAGQHPARVRQGGSRQVGVEPGSRAGWIRCRPRTRSARGCPGRWWWWAPRGRGRCARGSSARRRGGDRSWGRRGRSG
jgi:hypothetical protein